MERDPRLQHIQQSDLTESKLNVEFLDWLKTKGPTYLLIFLAAIVGVMLWNRWREHKETQVTEAWLELSEVTGGHPVSLAEVANDEDFQGVFAVPQLARLRAASAYLDAVAADRDLDATADPTTAAASLSPEKREEYLDRAAQLFQEVLDSEMNEEHPEGMVLHAFRARMGLAAVAESRGDADAARRHYEQAAAGVRERYPHLAEQAEARAADAEMYVAAVSLPAQAELPIAPPREQLAPATRDDAIDELLIPDPADAATVAIGR